MKYHENIMKCPSPRFFFSSSSKSSLGNTEAHPSVANPGTDVREEIEVTEETEATEVTEAIGREGAIVIVTWLKDPKDMDL